jgi:hypothetical protein
MSLTRRGRQWLILVTRGYELTVTAPSLELVVNWHDLIFGDIIVDAQVLFVLFTHALVQTVRHHLVIAALEGKEFTSVVVTQADVVSDLDTT